MMSSVDMGLLLAVVTLQQAASRPPVAPLIRSRPVFRMQRHADTDAIFFDQIRVIAAVIADAGRGFSDIIPIVRRDSSCFVVTPGLGPGIHEFAERCCMRRRARLASAFSAAPRDQLVDAAQGLASTVLVTPDPAPPPHRLAAAKNSLIQRSWAGSSDPQS